MTYSKANCAQWDSCFGKTHRYFPGKANIDSSCDSALSLIENWKHVHTKLAHSCWWLHFHNSLKKNKSHQNVWRLMNGWEKCSMSIQCVQCSRENEPALSPALEQQRQAGVWSTGQLAIQNEFQTSQGCIVQPVLKKKKLMLGLYCKYHLMFSFPEVS